MTISRTSKTLSVSVPPEMALRIETEVKTRGITKSVLFLEIFRAWEQSDRQTRLRPGRESPKNGEKTESSA